MYVELLTDVDYYFSEEYTTNKSNKYYLATNSIKNNPKNISVIINCIYNHNLYTYIYLFNLYYIYLILLYIYIYYIYYNIYI
jgi:hypothetical protein